MRRVSSRMCTKTTTVRAGCAMYPLRSASARYPEKRPRGRPHADLVEGEVGGLDVAVDPAQPVDALQRVQQDQACKPGTDAGFIVRYEPFSR